MCDSYPARCGDADVAPPGALHASSPISHVIPPGTISNIEFRSLQLQRFQSSLKLRPIELRARFLRSSPCQSNNLACNSLAHLSNIEIRSLELQRLWDVSKNDQVKLRATFAGTVTVVTLGPSTDHANRDQDWLQRTPSPRTVATTTRTCRVRRAPPPRAPTERTRAP